MSEKISIPNLDYDEREEPVFIQVEVANILNITQSAVSQAVSAGTVGTRDVGRRMPKIPASEVMAYAKRIGRDPEKVRNGIQDRTEATPEELITWSLVGFGVYGRVKNE